MALDERRKALQVETQQLQSERNSSSKAIGQAKSKGEDTAPLLAAVEDLGDQLAKNELALGYLQQELADVELDLPNMLDDSVPDGKDESDNKEVRLWGEPTELGFDAQDHIALGENLGMIDFEAASKISGSRFTVMSGPLARMQRALIEFEIGPVQTNIDLQRLILRDARFRSGDLDTHFLEGMDK